MVCRKRYNSVHERFEVDCNLQEGLFKEIARVVFPGIVVMRKVVPVVLQVELDVLW